MIESGSFNNKQILIIDKSFKKRNDKTWCFWDAGNIESFWKNASIVHHQWSKLWLKHPIENLALSIEPYTYKMIRSVDFYHYCFSIIEQASNVQLHYDEVTAVDATKGIVTTAGCQFKAPYIFSSVLFETPELKRNEIYLLQHFRGWWVETEYDAFDPEQADLMNFRTPQTHGCTFVYVLPVGKRKALIEYTLFSGDQLADNEHHEGLTTFISNELHLTNYRITEIENGIIPMTNFRFPQRQGKVFFIGTAGGQTKPSTGYTFSFIQKQTEALVNSMQQNAGIPSVYKQPSRFHFYDTVLLKVLHERKMSGADVFYLMFKKNKAVNLLRFLDNESNIAEEFGIMNSTNKSIFFPTAIRALINK